MAGVLCVPLSPRWRVVPLDASGLPSASQRSLPDPRTDLCELCGERPRQPLSSVLVIDGPHGLPVPFLICANCRRALTGLEGLLASASREPSGLEPPSQA